MNDPLWIWEQPNWPQFSWQAEALAPLLRACSQAQGRLLEMLGAVGSDAEVQSSLDAMLQNIVIYSAIEGEQLNVGSVRSSLARRLRLNEEGRATSRSEGLAELLLDTTRVHQQPLDEQRLFTWHRWLFLTDDQLLDRPLHISALRGEVPMQVVSGRIDRPTVHFEAPPRAGLKAQLADFLAWFESRRSNANLDPFLRAGIAHFWFVTLPPSMTATAASRAPLPTRHWLRASSRLFASMPCPRASLMIHWLLPHPRSQPERHLGHHCLAAVVYRDIAQQPGASPCSYQPCAGQGALLAGTPQPNAIGGADQSA